MRLFPIEVKNQEILFNLESHHWKSGPDLVLVWLEVDAEVEPLRQVDVHWQQELRPLASDAQEKPATYVLPAPVGFMREICRLKGV